MGSIKLPNLSINNNFMYYKNIFNNNASFWFYYYFYFLINHVIDKILKDGFLFKFTKNLFLNNKFKIINFYKNIFYLGLINLIKIQKWLIINVNLYSSISLLNFNKFENSSSYLNIQLIVKKKMKYKNLLK
jgi:hypothetical protein